MAEADATYTGNFAAQGTIDPGEIMSQIIAADPKAPFVQDFFKSVAQPLIGAIKNTKFESTKIDLSSLFGLTPEYAKSVQEEYQQVTKRALQAIQKQFSKLENLDLTEEFSLGGLIGKTTQFSNWSRKTYEDIVHFFLKTTEDTLLDMFAANKTGKIGILDALISPDENFAKWARSEHEGIVRTFFKNVNDQLDSWGRSLTHLREQFDKVDVGTFFKEKIDKILPTPRPTGPRPFHHALGSQPKPPPPQPSPDPLESGGLQRVGELHKQNVIVAEFEDDALIHLRNFLHLDKKQVAAVTSAPAPKKEKEKLGWGSLGVLAILGELLAAIGAGALAVSGVLDEGPLKGLKKLLARGLAFFAKNILKLVEAIPKRIAGFFKELFFKDTEKAVAKAGVKTVEKIGFKFGVKSFVKGLVKKIPFLGAIFGVAFAVSRFKQGDWIGGLLEIASGVASIYPGVGTVISVALDVLLAARDVAEGGPRGIRKAGGWGKWDKKVWEWLKKHWPIRGWIMVGEGIKKIFSGDIIGGLKQFGEGFGDVTPFGLIIDIFGKEKTYSGVKTAAAWTGNLLSNIWNWLKERWPMKGIVEWVTGVKDVLRGKVFTGLTKMAKGIFDESPFGLLLDIFGNEQVQRAAKAVETWAGDLLSPIWDWMKDRWPMKGIITFVEGAMSIGRGDVMKGLKQIIGGTWNVIGTPFEFIYNLLTSKETYVKIAHGLESADKFLGNLNQKIGEYLWGWFKHRWNNFVTDLKKALKKLGVPGKWRKKLESWKFRQDWESGSGVVGEKGAEEGGEEAKGTQKVAQATVPEKEEDVSKKVVQATEKKPEEEEKPFEIKTDDQLIDSIGKLHDQFQKMLKSNLQLVDASKQTNKSLGAIVGNTQEMGGDTTYNVASQQNNGGGQPRSEVRDPAYDFRKDVWSKMSQRA